MNELHVDTLERCAADGILDPGESVTLYSDGSALHGTLDCSNGRIRETITLRADTAVHTPPPTWCSCRGIASTPLGQLLHSAHRAYTAIDDAAAGLLDPAWPDIWTRLNTATTRYTEAERRPALRDLERRGRDASDSIARNSASRLGTHWLERSLAAQNLEIAVTPETALMFSIWGRRRRISDPQSGRPPSGIEHYYEKRLTQALKAGPDHLVVIFPTAGGLRDRADLLDRGIPHELALIAWHHRIPADTGGRLRLPAAAAYGLATVARGPQRERLGITRHIDETDENLETARVLWTDPGSEWQDFDEALDAARAL